ncbi:MULTISPECIES: hypothetical protein [Priestia]|nr:MULTISPECIES: hypothetical protein [Priestia]MDC0705887.1 hypothetical protein [Priestia sp. AB]MED4213530.1 hypothetical protein [Priestia megaterium]
MFKYKEKSNTSPTFTSIPELNPFGIFKLDMMERIPIEEVR